MQQLGDLAGAVLVFLQGLDDLLPLVGKFFGWVLQTLQVTVQVGDIIRHVGLLQQLVLGLQELARLGLVLGAAIVVLELGAAELEEGEDEVAVELADQLGQQVELGCREILHRDDRFGMCVFFSFLICGKGSRSMIVKTGDEA